MRIVVAGLGHIGRRHLTNLQRVDPPIRVAVWHQHRRAGGDGTSGVADATVFSIDEALAWRPDAALIAGPSSTHIETAMSLAEQGVHLMIEKPLSNTLTGVDDLLATCRSSSIVLMVAYCFRFYRPLQALRQAINNGCIGRVLSIRAEAGSYLPDWRPTSDYRTGVTAKHSLGGGVLLELSHEIDYVRWLCGEVTSVAAIVRRQGDLEIDVEDTAELLLELEEGPIASIHLDMTQRSSSRGCRVVGTDGTLLWDAGSHSVKLYTTTRGTWNDLHPSDPTAYEDMYRDELSSFLAATRGSAPQGATGEDGKRVLEVALAARQASDERRTTILSTSLGRSPCNE